MDSKAVALKALIQASMYGLVALFILLLLNATDVLLLVFAGVLVAVLLRGLADWLARKTGMPSKAALAVAILLPAAVFAALVWWLAPDIADQASQLGDRLPKALDRLRQNLEQGEWTNRILQNRQHLESLVSGRSNGIDWITGFFSSTFGAVGNIVFAVFIGLVLAIDPKLYIHGAIRLFPEDKRGKASRTFAAIGAALRGWLIAKLTAMAVIGVLTTLGLWLLGIELALVLGLIAAMLSFIPNFGPIASVIPAVLLALISGPDKALYVLLLYAGIQTFESYVLTPALQQQMVDMPPALLITMQVLLGVLTGILGVILATPLTAAAMVAIKRVYIDDLLEDRGQSGGPGRPTSE